MKVINDLFDYQKFSIVQDSDFFKFSLDSILLAEFVDNVKPYDVLLDLCTGNAVVPLILSYYYQNKIFALEIQPEIFALAEESISLNKKNEQIKLLNDTILNAGNYFPGNNFDIITANPPYFKCFENSILNFNQIQAIARHEIKLKLEELFQTVSFILKDKGAFYLVHLPERLEEILSLCEKYNLTAKKIQFVYTKKDKCANIVLIKCIKGGKNSLKVEKPIFINEYQTYQNIFRR